MFKPGQKVVCICDNLFTFKLVNFYFFKHIFKWKSKSGPKKDEIYKVTDSAWHSGMDVHCCKIEGFDTWYMCRIFREVDEKFAEDVLNKVAEKIQEDNLIESC